MTDATEDKPPSPISGWRPYQYYVLGLVLMVAVFHYLDRGILGVLQEPLKQELKLNDWQLGLLSGPAFALLYSVAGVTISRFAERMNRPTLLAAAVGVWSMMTALCGASVGFLQLALCRMGVGAGEGGCIPISQSILAESFDTRQRGFVMSVWSASPAVAGIITPVLGGLVAHAWGWRVAFVAVGLPGIIVALLIRFTLKEPRDLAAAAASTAAKPPAASTVITDIKWLFSNRAFLYLFLAAAFTGVGVSSMNAFRISFLVRSQHMNLAQAGAIWSIASIVGLAGSVTGGYLSDRFAGERGRSYVLVPAIGSIGSFIAYAVAFSQSGLAVVVGALMVSAFFYNLKNGPEYAAVQNIAPSHMRSTAAAVFMIAATMLGGSIGPLVSGGLSAVISRRVFASALGAFDTACPGGHAAARAAAGLSHACALASADGLRLGLLYVSFTFVIVTVLLYLSSLTIRINRE